MAMGACSLNKSLEERDLWVYPHEGTTQATLVPTVITLVFSFLCFHGPHPPENQGTEGDLIYVAH